MLRPTRRLVSYLRRSSGARASALLLFASIAAGVGNYAFNLICIRLLGPASYADVAAITALSMIVLLPFSAYQTIYARDVARLAAKGQDSDVRNVVARGLGRAWRAQLTLAVLLGAATWPLMRLVGIDDATLMLMLVPVTLTATSLPVAQGAIQGLGRFRALAATMLVPGMLRPALAVPLAIGAGAVGALTASAIAGIVGLIASIWCIRSLGLRHAGPAPARHAALPVLVGLLAYSSIANVDIVIAKALLGGAQAGAYASASLVGKATAYLAISVSIVLVPKVAARVAEGDAGTVILHRTLIAVAVLGGGFTALLAIMPASWVTVALGPGYEAAAPLLAPSAFVMTLCGLVNNVLAFSIARGDARYAWMLLVLAVAHVSLLVLLVDRPMEIVVITGLMAALALAMFLAFERRTEPRRETA